jgi:hypothetical protein
VLTTREVAIDEIEAALDGFEIIGHPPPDPKRNWQFGGPSLVLAYRPDVNGKVAVDTVHERWPDAMGDPKQDSITFGAWSMGQFGPFAFPGGLERAGQHSWEWEPGKTIAKKHTGIIRIRSSYVFGTDDKAPILPKQYDPLDEMLFLTEIAQAILEVPGTLCYFNPNGEVLRDRQSLGEMLEFCQSRSLIPLPAWCNARFFNLGDGWFMLDTVGNNQLDVPDFEAFFRTKQYEPARVDNYLRNVTLHLINTPGAEFGDGESIDGPNETNLTWRIRIPANPISNPPRQLVRLYPHADSADLKSLLGEKW